MLRIDLDLKLLSDSLKLEPRIEADYFLTDFQTRHKRFRIHEEWFQIALIEFQWAEVCDISCDEFFFRRMIFKMIKNIQNSDFQPKNIFYSKRAFLSLSRTNYLCKTR